MKILGLFLTHLGFKLYFNRERIGNAIKSLMVLWTDAPEIFHIPVSESVSSNPECDSCYIYLVSSPVILKCTDLCTYNNGTLGPICVLLLEAIGV